MSRPTAFKIPRRRLGFVWRRPSGAPRRWWLGVLCIYRRGRSPITGEPFIPETGARIYPFGFVVCMKALLAWLAALAVVAYFAGAGVLHSRLAEDPFNRVAYADLVAPWRWSRISRLRAEATLAAGKDLHDHGQLNEALFLLHVGLDRCPEDTDARTRLASIYLILSRRDLADAEFFAGLRAGAANDAFVRDALAFLQDSDRPDQLIDFCRQAREARGLASASLQALASAEASALLELGRPAEAVAAVERLPDAPPALLARTRAQAALAAKDFPAAAEAVAAWIAAAPRDPEALAMAVGVSRQAGRIDEMDAHLSALRALAPANPSFASMGVVQNILAQRSAEATTAFQDLVFRFGGDAALLDALARDLGKIRALDMLDRLELVLTEHGFDSQLLRFSRLNAQMDGADWSAAERSLALLGENPQALSENIRAFRQTAAAALDYCATGAPAARSTALDLIAQRPTRLKLYLQIHDWFAAAGRWEGARDVLVLAEGAFPKSRRLAERRQALEPHLKAIADAQVKTDQENSRKRESAGAKEQTANGLLAALAAHEKNAAWEDAIRLVEATRRQSPAWLPSIRDRLDRAELRAALALDDLPRVKLAASTYLREGGSEHAKDLCILARETDANGLRSAARLLVAEVLRRTPGEAEATALLAEWAGRKSPPPP